MLNMVVVISVMMNLHFPFSSFFPPLLPFLSFCFSNTNCGCQKHLEAIQMAKYKTDMLSVN